ncbi:MAG: methyltransferase domain-containing protein [Aquabacterium sp.]|uniref:class I SAM-dependent methyltransferase n=1 Tax=Aquabacterium sp. TaxID=1872578 RepID=UPI0027255209|nr:methyltransferase domain-containing protein [Aquabacterium sp.]MDO9003913.1 methyltransferase domain-containing protein [Aquabacterium sp.]
MTAADIPDLGYQVKFQSVSIEGGDDLQIRSLLDRQQFFDPDGAAQAQGISAATWPLFGMLWPSAQRLAGVMQQRDDLAGKRILEIGCGLGLASLVAHRRLANVTASDCHPLAETFLQANLLLNALPVMKYLTGQWTTANAGLGEFDLIIGSDVLYERSHPQQLSDFIERHSADVVEIVIVDPNRGHRSRFTQHMQALGFDYRMTNLDSTLSASEPYRGRMLHFTRQRSLLSA